MNSYTYPQNIDLHSLSEADFCNKVGERQRPVVMPFEPKHEFFELPDGNLIKIIDWTEVIGQLSLSLYDINTRAITHVSIEHTQRMNAPDCDFVEINFGEHGMEEKVEFPIFSAGDISFETDDGDRKSRLSSINIRLGLENRAKLDNEGNLTDITIGAGGREMRGNVKVVTNNAARMEQYRGSQQTEVFDMRSKIFDPVRDLLNKWFSSPLVEASGLQLPLLTIVLYKSGRLGELLYFLQSSEVQTIKNRLQELHSANSEGSLSNLEYELDRILFPRDV